MTYDPKIQIITHQFKVDNNYGDIGIGYNEIIRQHLMEK